MKYLIGIDIGTSGTKTLLIDTEGSVIASSTYEYPLYQPRNGWAEQDPADWWDATVKGLRQVISISGIPVKDIAGIGLSGQMHGLVMLDKNCNIIRNAIIWCDGRTSKESNEINEKVGRERLLQITANPAIASFTAAKILWVRNNEPENYRKCKHILLPKDYIRFKLTGDFATEVSDASGMQLLDVPYRCWSAEVLEKLEIDIALLPKVYESPEITGKITKEVSSLTGVLAGTIVVGGAGDNSAAAVGTGVVFDKSAFTTIGTSGVVYAHASKFVNDPQGRVHTFCSSVPGCWAVMGVTQAAGLSLRWFRDQFCEPEISKAAKENIDTYSLMDKKAEKVPVGSNKLIYLPYLMGERTPHLDTDCRGLFFGLSAIHTKSDLIRSVMEGVTFSLRDCLEVLRSLKIEIDCMMACGGGGKSPLWRQMLADMYECPVQTVISKEGSALGVAILAGVGAGIFDSVEQGCSKIIKTDSQQEPVTANSLEYNKLYSVYKELYKDLKNSFSNLANL